MLCVVFCKDGVVKTILVVGTFLANDWFQKLFRHSLHVDLSLEDTHLFQTIFEWQYAVHGRTDRLDSEWLSVGLNSFDLEQCFRARSLFHKGGTFIT